MKRSKLQTIGYVFIHTALMQLIVLTVFVSVCFLAYFGVAKYNSGILFILGAIAFVTMLFSFLCVSVFTKAYGVSMLARSRGHFDASAYKTEPIKRIDYSLGPKSVFTGKRSIYVREREVKGSGALVVMGIPAIWLGLTGILKFAIEALRVCLSDERQAIWEESRAYLIQKRNEQGTLSFFGFPILCGIALALVLAISFPTVGVISYRFDPVHIEFEVSEKEDVLDKYGNTQIFFTVTMKNTGSAKLRQLEGVLYFRDREGNLLFKDKFVFHVPYGIPSPDDIYLEKGEEWDESFYLTLSPDDADAMQMWGMELEDMEITFEVTQAYYKGDKIIDFSDKEIVVKPLGK